MFTKKFYSLKEVSDFLSLPPSIIKRLVKEDKMETIKPKSLHGYAKEIGVEVEV